MNIFKKLYNAFKNEEEEFNPYEKFTCLVYNKKTGELLGEVKLNYNEYKEKVAFDTKYIYRRKRDD